MNKKDIQHIPVLGDGDCLFHSITNYLHIDKNRKKHKDKTYSYSLNELSNQQWSKLSMNLRRKVVRWLRDNLDYKMPTGLTIRDEINEDLDYSESDQDINGYLRKMNKSGEYGGQIEITAIANILKNCPNSIIIINDCLNVQQIKKNIGFYDRLIFINRNDNKYYDNSYD